MRSLYLATLLLTAPLAASAQTTSLGVTNFDFETNGLADGGFSTGIIPTGWNAIPGNAPSGGNYGYFNPQDSAYTGTTGTPGTIGTMSGPNVFYFGTSTTGQGIQQTLATNFALNTSYTLTVSVGCRNNVTFQAGLTMQLLAGSTVLATNTFFNSTAGTFADYAVSYAGSGNTNSGLVGSPLVIRFSEYDQNATVAEADMDNVRVVTTTVPEPSTWAALLVGAGLLGAFTRRRVGKLAHAG